MSQVRVLHVIARMNIGGTATYISNLIENLEGIGATNLLAMGTVPKGEAEDGVVENLPVVRVPGLTRKLGLVRDFRAWLHLQRVIRDFKPDIIHSHTFKAGLLVRLSKSTAKKVHSFHGHHLYDPEFGRFERAVLNFVERKLAKRTDAIITIGNRVRDELLGVGIGVKNQYLPIPPGIEDPLSYRVRDVRTELGIDKDAFVVMWLGRFTRVKRPDIVKSLARELPEMTFVMAGGGELLRETKQDAPNNLKIVGYRDKYEMWEIADVGLCTSDSEGMPLSLIEAQMSSVPVVSTNVGSVAEILIDKVTGRLANDLRELAEALNWVQHEMASSSSMSDSARDNALLKFSASSMAEKHMEIYLNLLGKVRS